VSADHKVSVGWQIVFTFIPIVNFWAFYRIRRLQKYLFYVILPSIVMSTIYTIYNSSSLETRFIYWGSTDDPIGNVRSAATAIIAADAISFVFQAFAIYLMIIWSRKHNRQFDQSATLQKPE